MNPAGHLWLEYSDPRVSSHAWERRLYKKSCVTEFEAGNAGWEFVGTATSLPMSDATANFDADPSPESQVGQYLIALVGRRHWRDNRGQATNDSTIVKPSTPI